MQESHIKPHGGTLVNLLVAEDEAEQLRQQAMDWPSVTLDDRQLNELELLVNGGFSPLQGYLSQTDYNAVLADMRLADGTLWPMPVTLDVNEDVAAKLSPGQTLALRDAEGFMPAVLEIGEIYEVDIQTEAEAIFGTSDIAHPGVRRHLENARRYRLAGPVRGIELPLHFDFESLRYTPASLREMFHRMGWSNVVAYSTSEPMHRLQRHITLQAARDFQANILVHPLLGEDQAGDMNRFARVRGYREIVRKYPHQLGMLSLLPLSRRSAGPREALWHMIVRQNYGCSHHVIETDYASPRVNGRAYYDPDAAQRLLEKYQDELQIQMIAVEEQAYSPQRQSFAPLAELQAADEEALLMSDAAVKEQLYRGETLPDWFTYPDVEKELARVYPARNKIGFTLFFTGLSGSGKSTLARMVHSRLIEDGGRPVTLLDGDIVRLNLSSELGFSREHRNLNIRRIGFVANEISKNGGVAICAPIAPYTEMRRQVRELIEQHGAFIEIHVSTPLEVCEARDRKGLYARARKGIIPEFTGISDPYEIPEQAELSIDTSQGTPMEHTQQIMLYLFREGYLGVDDDQSKPSC